MLSAVLDLVLPPSCAGCGAKGASCCPRCLAVLTAAPARRIPAPAPPGLPDCWSAAPYEGSVRKTIVAYKERGIVALAAVLAEAVTRTAVAAIGAAGETLPAGGSGPAGDDRPAGRSGRAAGVRRSGHEADWAGGRFVVVPVPSGRRSIRERGHDPVGRLAALAAGRLRALGFGAEVWAGLRQVGRVADQVGLSCTERGSNLKGSLQVIPTAKGPPAACALLVDDIVTTGATLAEAVRALRSEGMRVPLAVTVGATRRRS